MFNKHDFLTQMSPKLNTCKRKNLTSGHQKHILMKTFEVKPYREKEEKLELANVLNIRIKRIENWFSERCFEKKKDGLMHID